MRKIILRYLGEFSQKTCNLGNCGKGEILRLSEGERKAVFPRMLRDDFSLLWKRERIGQGIVKN